jgi:hypothetical protein
MKVRNTRHTSSPLYQVYNNPHTRAGVFSRGSFLAPSSSYQWAYSAGDTSSQSRSENRHMQSRCLTYGLNTRLFNLGLAL